MTRILIYILTLLPTALFAQYPPQAGVTGSTAVHRNDNKLVAWATGCDLRRGYMHIEDKPLGLASAGSAIQALGAADNYIVSLGDSGVATLTFEAPVYNGSGFDFVVFENGFQDPANLENAFLELAFVKVSSDGINFIRFPASSLTADTPQIPMAGVYMNARKLNNLAGKYAAPYGTPFDLQELAGIAGLDINRITHIRLVDVIGSVTNHPSRDKDGNIINDPYPSPILHGGFDLDAVGVFYMEGKHPSVVGEHSKPLVSVYPNPVTDVLIIEAREPLQLSITNIAGKVLQSAVTDGILKIPFSGYPQGLYYLNYTDSNGGKWVEKIVKY